MTTNAFKPMKGFLVATINHYIKNDNSSSSDQIEVDVSSIPVYADYLSKNGASGVFVCGTTGDFSILSLKERLSIQKVWLESHVKSKFDHVIIHIGSAVWNEMIQLGLDATKKGASAVAITFPAFSLHAPQSEQQMVQYLAKVSAALPNIPLLVYNIHGATPPQHLNKMHPVIKAAIESGQVPTLAGMKYTSPNFIDAFDILTQLGLSMSLGCDEKMPAGYAMGFEAFIGSTYNIFCSQFVRVKTFMDEGRMNESKVLFGKLFEAVRFMTGNGYFLINLRVALNRILMHESGMNFGNEHKYGSFVDEKQVLEAEKICDELWTRFPDLLPKLK